MHSSQRAQMLVEYKAGDRPEPTHSLDLAKRVADRDPSVEVAPARNPIRRVYVLLGLVIAGWSIVTAAVLLVRWMISG